MLNRSIVIGLGLLMVGSLSAEEVKLSVVQIDQEVQVSFQTEADKQYQVFTSSDVDSSVWISGPPIEGDGEVHSFSQDSEDPATTFFKVEVLSPPRILTQTQAFAVVQGQSATLEVVMGGSEPLQYIWFKDNVPLLDHAVKGTKSVLRIDPATLEDAGVYLVAVANPAGNVRSAGISLEVLPLPPEPITIAGLVDGMVPIPAGTFVMGSPDDEEGRGRGEGPQTTVTISKPFWMGKYEVTQGQYEEIMGENPSWFNGTRIVGSDTGVFGTDLSRPVEQVGWEKVMEFCKRLTEQEHASGRLAADHEYRLPTAAQWEYACRAGTTTRFSYGDDYITKQGKHYGYAELGTYAWHASNSEAVTHSVGGKLPNPWGLYDMHGNVHEWCQNQADGSYRYPGGEQTDPVGPNSSRSSRVHRGGSAFTGALGCRSANRGGSSISDLGILGFRPVLVPVDYPKSP